MADTAVSAPWDELVRLGYYVWISVVEAIKILYVTTCDCRAVGQPFNSWFFPAFQHAPYSQFWTYRELTWLSGPYSLLWWGLNSPAFFGYWLFFTYLLTFDITIFYLVQRKNRAYGVYLLTLNLWFTTLDPVDFFVVLFAVLGRYRLVMLILAPLTKLPVGSELWLGNLSVWAWALTNPDSLHGPENYGRYLILGTIWLFSLMLYLHSRSHRKKLTAREERNIERNTGPIRLVFPIACHIRRSCRTSRHVDIHSCRRR